MIRMDRQRKVLTIFSRFPLQNERCGRVTYLKSSADNRQACRQTDRQVNAQTDRQTDEQIDRQTQTDRQTDRQIDRQTNKI